MMGGSPGRAGRSPALSIRPGSPPCRRCLDEVLGGIHRVPGGVVPPGWRPGARRERRRLSFRGWFGERGNVWVENQHFSLWVFFFFFSFESKNISWFFVIRNMLGVFFGQQPVKYRFPTKGMQGPFARRAKAFLKNKIKPPVFLKKPPGHGLEQTPGAEGSAGGPDPDIPVPGSAA